MNTTELTSISDNELFIDIHQNKSLMNNKNLLQTTQPNTNINSNYYMSIVDSIDYLGCINGNCSKIECKCKPNEKCNCSNSNLNSSNKNLESNSCNSANKGNEASANKGNGTSINNFVSNLIDFLFVLLLLLLLTYVVYNKSPDYLIYCLGITLIYIFYKLYML